MRAKKEKIILAFIVIILFAPLGFSLPDTIYFKDGGSIDGIAEELDETHIAIDMGIGTMTVRKDEIESIEKAAPEDNEQLIQDRKEAGISMGEWAPLGCEEIRIVYIKAKDAKRSLKKLKSNKTSIREKVLKAEERISELLKLLDKKSRELKELDADKDTKKYNVVVSDMNSLNARLNKENNVLKGLYSEEKETLLNLTRKSGNYRNAFGELKNLLAEKRAAETQNEMPSQELSFFEEMSAEAQEMENDFKKDMVNYISEDNQIIVDALINKNVITRLIVDTGASIVVISKDVAERLGVLDNEAETIVEITMADGTSVDAQPITLESIKVGDAEVKNVQAVVLERNVASGTDGLLGMSFLSSFVVSVDAASKKLIFEEVLERD